MNFLLDYVQRPRDPPRSQNTNPTDRRRESPFAENRCLKRSEGVMKRIALFACLALICTPVLAFAQWTDDPLVNTLITDQTGYQVETKITANGSGTIYLSWFAYLDTLSGYETYLQRLDSNGNELWQHNGLLISDHPTRSWSSDYGLAMDQDTCATVAFVDIRTGYDNVFAYRISPDGDFLWGDDGIALSNDQNYAYSPTVVVTDQGNIVFAWTSSTDDHLQASVHLQKVAPDGQIVWGDGVVVEGDSTERFRNPRLLPAENDEVIFVWAYDTGSVEYPTRELYAQKLDSAGNPVWAQPTPVYTGVEPIPVYVRHMVESDDEGGFFVGWTVAEGGLLLSNYVQHIDGEGALLMPTDGAEVSTTPNRNHAEPQFAYVAGSEELYVFWLEMNAGETEAGLYGQKLSGTGDRLWSDDGVAFYELADPAAGPFAGMGTVRAADDDVVVFYEYYDFGVANVVDSKVMAMRIDSDASYVWAEEHIELSSVQSWKSYFAVSDLRQNQWIVAWSDTRNDEEYEEDVYAQNIRPNGDLGPGDLGADGWGVRPLAATLSNRPNPFRDGTTIRFELPRSGFASLKVYSVSGDLVDTVVNGQLPAGVHAVVWQPSEEASGAYFYRLEGDDFASTGRMVVAR